MAGTGKKWLTGFAIACGALLLLVGLAGVAGYILFSGVTEGFRQARATGKELAAAHGAITAFTPPLPASLPADRLQVFITVRESLGEPQARLRDAVSGFPAGVSSREGGPFRTIARVFRGLGDLIRPMGEYVKVRNDALLKAGMGQGEYLFNYGLVYLRLPLSHAW